MTVFGPYAYFKKNIPIQSDCTRTICLHFTLRNCSTLLDTNKNTPVLSLVRPQRSITIQRSNH